MTRSQFPRTILVSLCDRSAAPIYAMDGQGCIVYCNKACQEWLKVEGDELIGRRCRWQANGAQQEAGDILAAQLCPPPEIGAARPGPFVLQLPTPDGRVTHVAAWGLPLGNAEEDNSVLVVVGVGDLNESQSLTDTDPRSLHQYLLDLNRRFRNKFRVEALVGESAWQRRIRQQVALAGCTRDPVSIVASTGMAADTIARTIHACPEISTGIPAPLAAIPCELLDIDSLNSTLSVLSRSPSATESPCGGTLLLMEVEQLPRDAQQWLANEMVHPAWNLRIVTTSRRDLIELAHADQFDLGLACLQTCITIRLPDLAERMEDVPYLAQQIVEGLNEETGRRIEGLAPDALDLLQTHSWPGQLVELQQRIREAYGESKGPWIRAVDFAQVFRDALAVAPPPTPPVEPIDLEQLLRDVEVRYLRRAVELSAGNKAQAARLVGMHRAKFLRRWDQLVEGVTTPLTAGDESGEVT